MIARPSSFVSARSASVTVGGRRDQVGALSKSNERKVLLTGLLRERTSVSSDWIASRLVMGLPGSASRMLFAGRADKNLTMKRSDLAELIFSKE